MASDVYSLTGHCPRCGAPIYGPEYHQPQMQPTYYGGPGALVPDQLRCVYSCDCKAKWDQAEQARQWAEQQASSDSPSTPTGGVG